MQFSFIGMAYVLQLHSCGTENLYRRYLYEVKTKSLLYDSQEQTFLEDSSSISPEELQHRVLGQNVQYKGADSKLLPALFSCSLEALN